jgi:hypothetical protein
MKLKNKKEIKQYLESLPADRRTFVMQEMVKQAYGIQTQQEQGGECGPQPTDPPPTPNGRWVCNKSTKEWEWIPEIG